MAESSTVARKGEITARAIAKALGQAFDMAAECLRICKKAAGRLLDGVEHNGMPEVVR